MYDYEVLKIFIKSTQCKEAIEMLEGFTIELENSLLKHLNLLSDEQNFKLSLSLPNGKRRKLTIECRARSLTCEDKNLIQDM